VRLRGGRLLFFMYGEECMEHKATDSEKNKKIHAAAMERFKHTLEATAKLRAEALEDLEFYSGDQWDDVILRDRKSDRRPALTINKLPAFCNQVINDMRQSRPSLKIRPVDTATDPETAEVIDGLVRSVLSNGDAREAIDNASFYQVTCGFGYFRILTDYVADDSFDQELRLERIENPFSVYFPVHLIRQPDYSDAPYCFIRTKMTRDEFKTRYPDADPVHFDGKAIGDTDWEGEDYLYVAEYFTVEEKNLRLYLLSDGTIVSEKPDANAKSGPTIVNERTTIRRTVQWHLITGRDVIDSRDWPGSWIPVIPVLGQELNINGRTEYLSLIRFTRDPQRMYNYWHSAFTEQVALAPRVPWLVAEGQVDDYRDVWETANSKNHAYLPYRPTSVQGNPVAPPQRIAPPEAGGAILQGIQLAADSIKSVIGIFDASLGMPGNEQSGRAIIARQRKGDNATFHYADNQSRAIKHAGRIIVDLIPGVYDVARTIRILGEDMADEVVHVNQVHPDNNGRLFDVTVGRYDVIVDVGASYETKRIEAAQNMLDMIRSLPDVGSVNADLIFRMLDFPLASEAADRTRRLIQAKYPGVVIDKTAQENEPTFEEMQAVIADLQQLQQQHTSVQQNNAQLSQLIGQLQQQLADKEADRRVDFAKAELRARSEVERANIGLAQEHVRQETQRDMPLR
jgi:hypothetical protein